MKKYLVFYLFAWLVLACYKPLKEPKNFDLPQISNSGKGTLACLVDKNVWYNYGNSKGAYNSTVPNVIFAMYYEYQKEDNSSLTLYGQMTHTSKDQFFKFSIIDKNIKNLGQFEAVVGEFIDFKTGKSYTNLDKSAPLKVKITKLDKTNKIASGTFDGVLYDKDQREFVTLTDGRFDVVYK